MNKFFALFCFGLPSLFGYLYEFETPLASYLQPIEITTNASGLESIDCIYVVNLDERSERWARMKTLFDGFDIKLHRVKAINGWKIPQETIKTLTGPYPSSRFLGGQIGCILSHVSIFKDAYQRGFNIIWMMEDDVEILEDIKEIPHLLAKLSKIDPDWDVFYTDTNSRSENGGYSRALIIDHRPDQELLPLPYYIQRIKITPDLMQIRSRYGTYSMIWSRKGIKKALDYFTHVYLWTCIDGDIPMIPGIRQYAARKDIVTNLKNHSTSDVLPMSTLNPANRN